MTVISRRKKLPKSAKTAGFTMPFLEEFSKITLREIEAFHVLAECECVTKAATKLGCEPYTVSRLRKSLEDKLGFSLFEQSGPSTELNDRGEGFRKDAEQIYTAAHAGFARFEKRDAVLPKRLRIGYAESPTVLFFSDTLSRFRDSYPDLETEEETPWADQIVRGLRTGKLDVGISVRPYPELTAPDPEYRELVQYRMFCALGIRHRLARQPTVSLKEIRLETLLLMGSEAHQYNRHISLFFSKVGRIRRKHNCPNVNTQINKVVAGQGVALALYPMKTIAAQRKIKFIPIEPAIFIGVGALFVPPVNQVVYDFIEAARQITQGQFKELGGNARGPDVRFTGEVEMLS
jgi:DNA-binding transcriptional LysR family regulator